MIYEIGDPYLADEGKYIKKFGVGIPARESFLCGHVANVKEALAYGIKFEQDDIDIELLLRANLHWFKGGFFRWNKIIEKLILQD